MHIVDMHCDTISELLLAEESGLKENLRGNSKHLDLLRMQDAGYLLQNFALYVNKQKYPDVKARVLELLNYYQAEMEKNADLIVPITCMADIESNKAQGKMSAMLTLEEGAALEGSVDTLKEFYNQGVRMITLTWNHPNELGYPHGYNGRSSRAMCKQEIRHNCVFEYESERYGLTPCGFEIVETMEELGVIVDVSHLSDNGFYDVLSCTRKPFVASHSNSREICPMSRNLPDDMIRHLAERGGVMGLNFYPSFLRRSVSDKPDTYLPGDERGTIASVIAHAKHITNVGGIEVLGLGSDFDGIDGHKELPGAQAMPQLIDAFAKAGFRASEIEKILSGNVLRVYRDVIG